eukprot:6192727-Pleurochrysis_carterae.AAC.2
MERHASHAAAATFASRPFVTPNHSAAPPRGNAGHGRTRAVRRGALRIAGDTIGCCRVELLLQPSLSARVAGPLR